MMPLLTAANPLVGSEAGQPMMKFAAEIVPLAPGCGGSVPPGLYHSVHNRGEEPLEILAIHTPPTR